MKDLSTLLKLGNNVYNRIIVGTVFGLCLFAIWPFIHYSVGIEGQPDSLKYTYLGITGTIALIISIILTKVPHKEIITVVTASGFIASMIISNFFETNIKNQIAINSSYFSETNEAQDRISTRTSNDTSVSHYNYKLTLSNKWKKQTDKGPMFIYYNFYGAENKAIELRPKCFSNSASAFTDIIENMKKSLADPSISLKQSCYRAGTNEAVCTIAEATSDQRINRLRWYRLNTGYEYGITLDFAIHEIQPDTMREIEPVINSASFDTASVDSFSCISLSEWM